MAGQRFEGYNTDNERLRMSTKGWKPMEALKILLVDDDPDLLEMLLSIFTHAG